MEGVGGGGERRVHTVSKRGYSSYCHVILRLLLQVVHLKSLAKRGITGTLEPLEMHLIYEMIVSSNSGHDEHIRLCMGIFAIGFME